MSAPMHLVGLRPTEWQEALSAGTDPRIHVFDYVVDILEAVTNVGRFERKGDVSSRNRELIKVGRMIVLGATAGSVFLSRSMALKFPGACIRCRRDNGCACPETYGREHSPPAGEPNPKLLRYTLQEWQSLLRDLYHDRNAERGMERTIGRLHEEVGEAAIAYKQVRQASAAVPVEAMNEEFADMLAWWLAVVNLADLCAEELLSESSPKR